MKKLKNKKGFTLVEMLACVVTLILIGLICSGGMRLAMNSLRASTFDSNSRTVEAALDIYISDLLRHASDVNNGPEGVTFTNQAYYIKNGTLKIDTTGSKVADAGYLVCTGGSSVPERMLANKGIYTDNLYIKDFTLSYEEATGIFTGGYKIVSSVTDSVRDCSFSYRMIEER